MSGLPCILKYRYHKTSNRRADASIVQSSKKTKIWVEIIWTRLLFVDSSTEDFKVPAVAPPFRNLYWTHTIKLATWGSILANNMRIYVIWIYTYALLHSPTAFAPQHSFQTLWRISLLPVLQSDRSDLETDMHPLLCPPIIDDLYSILDHNNRTPIQSRNIS